MEEGEYRSTYHSVNQQRCIFEKSILTRNTNCQYAHRFCLADREGIACKNQHAMQQCSHLLNLMRSRSAFALRMTRIDEPLPYAKEIRVQLGGISGLNKLVNEDKAPDNIYAIIRDTIKVYGDADSLPYDEITRSITDFKSKKRSRKIRD